MSAFEAVAWAAVITALFTCTAIQLVLVVAGVRCFRLARRAGIVARRVMDCDKLIDELLSAEEKAPVPKGDAPAAPAEPAALEGPDIDRKRERLAALAVGGQARQYLGRSVTAEQVEALPASEVKRLYARYSARLGAAMTKTLGQAAFQLYASAAGAFLPIPPASQLALAEDLEADPFVSHAVSAATCELYHRWGMYLAPVTAALTTARHCQFGAGVKGRDTCDGLGEIGDDRSADSGDCGGAAPYPDASAD